MHNIVIDRVEDIQDLRRRDLNALIEYIWNTYRVHIRRHEDLGTRRADVVAAWQGTWALPLVLPPAREKFLLDKNKSNFFFLSFFSFFFILRFLATLDPPPISVLCQKWPTLRVTLPGYSNTSATG